MFYKKRIEKLETDFINKIASIHEVLNIFSLRISKLDDEPDFGVIPIGLRLEDEVAELRQNYYDHIAKHQPDLLKERHLKLLEEQNRILVDEIKRRDLEKLNLKNLIVEVLKEQQNV